MSWLRFRIPPRSSAQCLAGSWTSSHPTRQPGTTNCFAMPLTWPKKEKKNKTGSSGLGGTRRGGGYRVKSRVLSIPRFEKWVIPKTTIEWKMLYVTEKRNQQGPG